MGCGLQRMNGLQPRARARARPGADLAMGRGIISGHWDSPNPAEASANLDMLILCACRLSWGVPREKRTGETLIIGDKMRVSSKFLSARARWALIDRCFRPTELKWILGQPLSRLLLSTSRRSVETPKGEGLLFVEDINHIENRKELHNIPVYTASRPAMHGLQQGNGGVERAVPCWTWPRCPANQTRDPCR